MPVQPVVSRWADLPAATQAQKWENISPGTFERILIGVERAERHDRRMDWADVGLRLLGMATGLGAVVILGVTALHFASHGAPTQGLGVFGTGSASIIGAFVTTRRSKKGD
ncbi:hypothetical protein [Amycolatopsis rubida]|uniref:Uncharacterized membrane protein n=1 Tax=Amycolatopsis rubida TaxID=112413 RepID=A0A1I5NC93_9PSEU|nr:hypothetical protein [Amycolatopsis rubida]SFP18841.1 Uncharacterized membrane protein [Amycolatopsis rubida]